VGCSVENTWDGRESNWPPVTVSKKDNEDEC
jgi:hypothetical protein